MDVKVYAVIAVLVLAYLYKRRSDKRKRGKGGSEAASVTPVLPAYPKGYMSVTVHNGKVHGGTYQLHGPNKVFWPGGSADVPVGESVYHMVPDGHRILLCCEHAGGHLYQLMGGKVTPLMKTAKKTVIDAGRVNDRISTVSTDFDSGGIAFDGGSTKILATGKWHARQLIQYAGNWYILAFDYGSETGGWFVSSDGKTWTWRPRMTNMRPLRAVVHQGALYLACSPYTNGNRHGPATLMRWDGRALTTHFKASDGHAMFFGLASDGESLYAGTLTTWNGTGRANLYKDKKLIWTAPEPEITDIHAEDGVVHVATRNAHGSGRVYRITGEPGGSQDKGTPATSIGGGFVWKPVSEGDHNAVVLLPAAWATPNSVTLNGEAGHDAGRTNGNRSTWRFSKPGARYGLNVKLVVDGKVYIIPNGGQRIG